ncbi:MAG: acyl carrier protein [Thermoleophilia bacterium]
MTEAEIFEQIKALLVDQLGVEEADIKMEASFQDDLDADSLDLVELIMEMEDKFSVKISDEDAEKIRTVGEAVNYITAHS